MPRTGRQVSDNGVYYIFASGEYAKPLTKDDDDKQKLIDILLNAQNQFRFDVFCYTITNNEIHALIREYRQLEISHIMKYVFSSYTQYYNSKYSMKGKLLHDRFSSTPTETFDDVKKYLRYIHQTPVKLKECTNLFSYQFSSYNEFFKDDTKVVYKPILDLFNNENVAMARTKFKLHHTLMEINELKGAKRHSYSMEDMVDMLNKHCDVSLESYKQLAKIERYEIVSKMKKLSGLSLRQLETLFGLSRATIAKL